MDKLLEEWRIVEANRRAYRVKDEIMGRWRGLEYLNEAKRNLYRNKIKVTSNVEYQGTVSDGYPETFDFEAQLRATRWMLGSARSRYRDRVKVTGSNVDALVDLFGSAHYIGESALTYTRTSMPGLMKHVVQKYDVFSRIQDSFEQHQVIRHTLSGVKQGTDLNTVIRELNSLRKQSSALGREMKLTSLINNGHSFDFQFEVS